MSESSQIALVDLTEWLQKATAHLIEPLKDKGKNLLSDIKDRLEMMFVKTETESFLTVKKSCRRKAPRRIVAQRLPTK